MSEDPQLSPAANPGSADDPVIPLLTDRIFLPAVDLDTALPASLLPAAPADDYSAPEPEAQAPVALADADDALARETDISEAPPTGVSEEASPTAAGEPAFAGHTDEATGLDAGAAIEAELDRDLVTASDADFDALLAAEQQLGAGDAQTGTAAAATAAVESPPVAVPLADEATIAALAEALRASLLQRVAARLPAQVNAAVRDLMQPAIDQAMARLGEEAEVALRITLQELVEQVLREELARRNGDDAPR
jgi:hypothetical protein